MLNLVIQYFKKNIHSRICLCILLFYSTFSYGQLKPLTKTILYYDNFDQPLDSTYWKVEMVSGIDAKVISKDKKLLIDSPYGVTVWYKKQLHGNIIIEYDWEVIVKDGKNDRLSDLNQFGMATDPKNNNLFTRNGKFSAYDSLSLYYVGMGGNKNTTTRFRKYNGNGERKLLQEYSDEAHLLKANHKYHITINTKDGNTSFSVDGKEYFFFTDINPLKEGFFGFRSTHARHEISNFRVMRND